METKLLTPNQVKLLLAIIDSEYHDGHPVVDNHVWSDGIHADMGVSEGAVGGIVSAAQQAGLVVTSGGWDKGARKSDRTIAITQLGFHSLAAHKAAANPDPNRLTPLAEVMQELGITGDTTEPAPKAVKAEKYITLQSVSAEHPICVCLYTDGTATVYGCPVIDGSSPADLSVKVAAAYKGRDLGLIRKWITLLAR